MRRGPVGLTGSRSVAIGLATLVTAGVHLYLVVTPRPIRGDLRQLFLLAAVGYLVSLAAVYVPFTFFDPVRWPGRLGLLATTVGSIVGYFVVVGFAFSPLSLIDKLTEAVLAVLIVTDMLLELRNRRQEVHPGTADLALGVGSGRSHTGGSSAFSLLRRW